MMVPAVLFVVMVECGDGDCASLLHHSSGFPVFPKTDASKHYPVYATIDFATLKVPSLSTASRTHGTRQAHQCQTQVSSFTFPLEVSKPFFALSSPHGTVGLLQLPDDSLEWFQGTAANGKLDISRRFKTSLASYGGVSQGMVQVRAMQA
jgi:hypothetical protein